MDITRRCDYACRMLRAVCLASDRVSVTDIAESEGVPYSFARSIQHDLVKAGFLSTSRGARGGVSLARDLSDVTVLDVLRAVEGSIACSPCSEDPAYCTRSCTCAYHRVWCGADRLLEEYFGSITLEDLFGADQERLRAEGACGPEVARVSEGGAEQLASQAALNVLGAGARQKLVASGREARSAAHAE